MNKKILLILLALLTAVSLYAQQITVHGTVISKADGEPLIGATILDQSTNNGVATDIDGNFDITVQKGAKLLISYVGFTPQTVTADSENLTI